MKRWQLQDAKSRFSQVVDLAISGSPQLITRHGKPVAYVISTESYEALRPPSIHEVMLNRPHKELDLTIEDRSEFLNDIEL